MPKWKCEACGETVFAKDKPPQCPCGSEDIKQVKMSGLLGKFKSILRL